jgi:hypothetical protein
MAHTYLNQGGTRWASDSKILVTGFFNGKRYYKMRKPMYWEQFGNFARCNGVIELKLEKCYRVR